MSSTDGREYSKRPPGEAADRALWLCARSPAEDPGACLSALDLAAFVDGRLSETRRAEIEGHLAGCTPCIQAVREIRALLAEAETTPMLVPRGVPARARRLVKRRPVATRQPQVSASGHPLLRLLGRGGLVAAACLGVCVVGYLAGLRASSDGAATDLAEEMSFGTFDSLAENGADLDLFLAPEDAAL